MKKVKIRKIVSSLLATLLVFNFGFYMTPNKAQASETTFSSMLSRAEAIVNYQWVPNQNISTWNANTYNGRTYFAKGETVTGMPYSLFTSEVVSDSLLSLSQYKNVVSSNYSATKYCNSVGATRTGPVYGNCCATFVSEVFGGDFMYGSSPRYDSVSQLRKSTYANTTYNATLSQVEAGDALSNSSASHIIWVGDINSSTMTIYESTPPICRKVVLNKSQVVDSNGYFLYGGSVYNILTKPASYTDDNTETLIPSNEYPLPIKGYINSPTTRSKVYDNIGDSWNGHSEIYVDDYCTLHEIYDNGWAKVTYPIPGGTSDYKYVLLSDFIPSETKITPYDTNTLCQGTTYRKSDGATSLGWVGLGDTVKVLGKSGSLNQIIYPVDASYGGGWKLGWISENDLESTASDVSISNIFILSNPSKTDYFVGDTLNTSGLTLTATMTNGTTQTITSGFTVDTTSLTTAGTKTVTVTYAGKTTTFNVNVSDVSISNIFILSNPSKTDYMVGDELDTTGLRLIVLTTNGLYQTVTTGFTVDTSSLTTAGTKTVTVTYAGKTTTFNVNVEQSNSSTQYAMKLESTKVYNNGVIEDTNESVINGVTYKAKLQFNNFKTFLPARSVAQAIGLEVGYNSSTGSSTFTNGTKTIEIIPNSNNIIVVENGDVNIVNIGVAPIYVKGVIHIPVRAVIEQFGFCVNWCDDGGYLVVTDYSPSDLQLSQLLAKIKEYI